MILSHKHKFIFIKPLKVGGTSLEIALSKFCGPKDIITPISPEDEDKRRGLGFRGAQNHKLRFWHPWRLQGHASRGGKREKHFSNHMSLQAVKDKVPQDIFDSYYKFTVVRNPFDTIVSRYYWRNRDRDLPDFTGWLKDHEHLIQDNWRKMTIDGRLGVDKCVQYENLEQDLAEVSRRLGLDENIFDIMKSIRAKSHTRKDKKDTAKMYEEHPEAESIVRGQAGEEIALFDYTHRG